ncbi:hypothetical protein OEZ86_012193 [Tetradesmus obliquus]|nr:hypothetical protein OEZ86_012193 [Tetradesmus obliquus]
MSARCCQAEGCTEDLVALGKPYFLKKKICEQHMRAEEVHKAGCGDSLWRFCQQCGRLEPLSNFDGTKRNCPAALPAAAAAAAVLPATVTYAMGQPRLTSNTPGCASACNPAAADRLQALTSQMAQMQAMLLQMQQSLEIARRL